MIILSVLLSAAAPAPDCRSPVTQADMNECARRDFNVADAALNAEWRRAKAAAEERDKSVGPQKDKRPTYAAALLQSQRSWLTFRNAQCRVEGYVMRGGTAEPLLVGSCLARMTKDRTKQLKDIQQGY